jgi:hypothetical protein
MNPFRRFRIHDSGRIVSVALVFAAVSLPAFGQEAGHWEIGAFGGGYFGSRIFTSEKLNIKVSNPATYGVRVGYGVTRSFHLEANWSHAAARLEPTDPATGALVAPTAPIDINSYELDALFEFGKAPLIGYFGPGLGAMSLHPNVPGISTQTNTRPMGSLALGGKFFFTQSLGLRVDGRYRWRATRNRLGTTVCNSDGCFAFDTDLYSSAELSGGLTFRF